MSHVDSGKEQFEQFVRAAALSIDIDGARGVGWAFISDDGTGKIGSVKITYLSPSNPGNRSAIGFDMYREQKRRDAIDRAIATGKPMIRQINVVSAATAKLLRKIERYNHSVARL